MSKKLEDMIDSMTKGQTEVIEAIVARKGERYANAVALAAGTLAVLEASGMLFRYHPQRDKCESLLEHAAVCVVDVGIASLFNQHGDPEVPCGMGYQKFRDEFDGDLKSVRQQVSRRCKGDDIFDDGEDHGPVL